MDANSQFILFHLLSFILFIVSPPRHEVLKHSQFHLVLRKLSSHRVSSQFNLIAIVILMEMLFDLRLL